LLLVLIDFSNKHEAGKQATLTADKQHQQQQPQQQQQVASSSRRHKKFQNICAFFTAFKWVQLTATATTTANIINCKADQLKDTLESTTFQIYVLCF